MQKMLQPIGRHYNFSQLWLYMRFFLSLDMYDQYIAKDKIFLNDGPCQFMILPQEGEQILHTWVFPP